MNAGQAIMRALADSLVTARKRTVLEDLDIGSE